MKILFITAKSDSPSARWRVLHLLPHFEKAGLTCVAEEVPAGMFAKLAQARRAADFDVVVLQKRLLPKLVFNRLRKFARRLVFEFDDNVVQKRADDGTVRTSPTRERRFRRQLRETDAAITTNDFLAEQARRVAAQPSRVHILPSVIDPSRYPVRPPAAREGPLTIGWMGSESNLHYLEIVHRPLTRLCRREEEVKLKIVSEKEPPLPGVRVEHRRFDPARESADLASFDIAIAPLVEDAWTRGKISTKILAYFATGLPVVASDVLSNRLYAKDGENALLAGTLQKWEDHLAGLIAHPEERERLGAAARASVERDFSVSAMVPRYVELFRSLSRG